LKFKILFVLTNEYSRKLCTIFAFGLTILATSAPAQVVNIENRRMQTDSVRIAGQATILFNYTENNTQRLLVSRNALALQVKSRNLRDLWLFLLNADLSLANGTAFSNASFAHVRYNRKYGARLRWEAMAQWQYNRLLGIQTRALLGSGPRYKVISGDAGVAYFGSLYMLEYEQTTSDPAVERFDHRLSSYWSMSFDLPKWLPGELVSTTYYQPRLDRFADFRISHETSIELKLTTKLRATLRYTLLYDAVPPSGIRSRAQSFEQGLKFAF